ncbi:sugar phosphate isomerase/epimerase family protein [Streptomyces sp. NPDC002454]
MTTPAGPRPAPPARIRIGSAPDSWGVWFAEDPRQVPWPRFLDEVAAAGYEWIELGPYGYLPTDPAVLAEETGRRGLRISAGTVFAPLHHGDAAWEHTRERVAEVAELARATGAEHLVVIPSFWRDDRTGAVLEDPTLTAAQWRALTSRSEWLGREVRERFGLRLVVHPHADTHVDTEENVVRLLDGTDPELVSLCLDTGHYAYCEGDAVRLIETHGERIGYLHLKQVDPAVLAGVRAEGLPFGPAVARGVMCEPPAGVPDLGPVLTAARALDADLFAVVEQDMYPCDPDAPLPIARRTRSFLRSCGV